MRKTRPLDVDDGLPLPEAGQASTVFSLSGLFGAYFGIASVLGIPAVAGLAFGTVLALIAIRYWIVSRRPERFEQFLFGLLQGNNRNAVIYALLLSLVQCAFAGSELLILREVAKTALGLKSEQATLVAIGVAIVGYFYILLGGYMALFRTDVLQFMMVGLMALVSGAFILFTHPNIAWSSRLLPRSGYWNVPLIGTGKGIYFYHFAIAAVMGFGCLAASPDTWKRVFQVTRKDQSSVRFLTFAIVGVVPYLILLPFVFAIGPIPDGPLREGLVFLPSLSSNLVFVAASLGLVASFLSSFDGALLAAVHTGLMLQRKKSRVELEISRFHWLMVAALFTVFFLFKALYHTGNVYLLANFLMGFYALIGGLQLGTKGAVTRLPENGLLAIVVVGCAAWLIYFVQSGLPNIPTTHQLNTVPAGVLMFVLTAVTAECCCFFGGREVIDQLNTILGFLRGRRPDEIARICAHFLAPAVVLGLTGIGFFGGGAGDLDRPIAISELKSEVVGTGSPAPKRGVVIIAEPGSAEYRIPLGPRFEGLELSRRRICTRQLRPSGAQGWRAKRQITVHRNRQAGGGRSGRRPWRRSSCVGRQGSDR